jgi:hypothetical protein
MQNCWCKTKRLIIVSTLFCAAIYFLSSFITNKNEPWQNKPQQIPGRIECEFYDVGGEGIAYHDTDSINNGSGKLNPVNGNPLHEFRIKEGVDISYTKSGGVDNNAYNMVQPEMNHLYVGWTHPGEWTNYTVDIQQSGVYQVGIMYTSHDQGGILFSLDSKKITDTISIPSTYNANDSTAWRQWHHWNYLEKASEIKFPKGKHMLTLYTAVNGNMNYDYIKFTLLKN